MKNSNIQFKATTPRQNLRRGLFLIPLVLALAALTFSATARALNPPPDGGYRNETTAEGDGALFSLTTGFGNTALGFNALNSDTEGSFNTATGRNALRFHITGDANTATGGAALVFNTDGVGNTATGRQAMGDGTTGSFNTATGWHALSFNNADRNTANGAFALYSNITGSGNVANGNASLYSNTTGSGNVANGIEALVSNTTGGSNIALGAFAGGDLTTGDFNIDIGNAGVAAESSTIRIGTSGDQTRTFIAGITGVAVAGAAVKVNANGQLGVAPSSERFKADIKPMDKASEAILALKPVTFRYKNEVDSTGIPQFGLVAEQVAKVNPALVDRDAKGEIYTVRYEAVNAMLLNEFLKEHRKVQGQEATIAQLKSTLAKQETIDAHQQEQIEALTAGLQKVSAQLELNKLAPQTVKNSD
jgi:uncharacterized coiled-coil protein SlyX